ncbi:MAG: 50S ribosomal protein L4 [Acidimicrobiia bacterium]
MAVVVEHPELPASIFGIQPNVPVMHQVVTAQLAAARSGTHSTKTRAEVSGGGAKPWRQKGTGRARQGSSRAPHWSGGGVAHGPTPRSYRQRTPKKMVWLALRSALSDRAATGAVVVVEGWGLAAPKTKEARQGLKALGVEDRERVLVVLPRDDEAAWKSFRNLGERVALTSVEELSAYDVLVADRVIFTADTLAALARRAEGAPSGAPEGLGDAGFGAASPPVIDPTPATPGSEVPLASPPDVPEEAPVEAAPADEAGEPGVRGVPEEDE